MIRGQLNAFILKSIEEKPMSGYSLMKSIGETIGSRPSSGSVYPLLEKMRAEGAIEIKKEGRVSEVDKFIYSDIYKISIDIR